MAGDWIKMRTNLAQDPAVISTARKLKCSEFKIVGLLHWLWGWADGHTVDGRAEGVDCEWIDKQTHTEGFCEALVEAGWLGVDEKGLTIPGFDKHNGASAKSRAQTARRVARHKAKTAIEEEPEPKKRLKKGVIGEILDLLAPDKEYAHLVVDPKKKGALKDWLAYLKEKISKKYTSMGAARHLKMINDMAADEFVLAVDNSIKNNWQGLFPPKKNSTSSKPSTPEYEEYE